MTTATTSTRAPPSASFPTTNWAGVNLTYDIDKTEERTVTGEKKEAGIGRHETESPSMDDLSSILRILSSSTSDADTKAHVSDRPTVRQASTGAVRVLWKGRHDRVDVYIWPDGSVDINPLGDLGRPHLRVEADGLIKLANPEKTTPSPAAASGSNDDDEVGGNDSLG